MNLHHFPFNGGNQYPPPQQNHPYARMTPFDLPQFFGSMYNQGFPFQTPMPPQSNQQLPQPQQNQQSQSPQQNQQHPPQVQQQQANPTQATQPMPGYPPMPQPLIAHFMDADGKIDFDKTFKTVDQCVKTANQIGPLLKQMSSFFSQNR
ncbi:YppG family protein [Desertibacillus haloalkaliphilus]|uniref:YppG family protein n=1 Tax=Desertibacillus haloalkaliphilus TaxID=1328930 RepID=UPI001C2536CD|nr:YppG family protein [Desertibacillus haloalkaliphilus]MBU8907452.1 YppG family protein [Desertibacillus haloalkaliphilus]